MDFELLPLLYIQDKEIWVSIATGRYTLLSTDRVRYIGWSYAMRWWCCSTLFEVIQPILGYMLWWAE